jgi:acyl carrier protein
MANRETILSDVREMLVEVLGVDADEVTPQANFFHDLGGESIDVLDLSFRCTNKYGMTIPFQELVQPHGGNGPESPEELANRLAEQFPSITVTADLQLNGQPSIQSLFTVDTIVQIIEHSLNKAGSQAK